jgi:hypothetical protein
LEVLIMTYLNPTAGAKREGSAGHVATADLEAASVTSAKIAEDVARTIQVALSSAQILALSATPVSLIPAPGAGKIVIVDSILFKMVRTATAYANGGALEFRYTDGSGAKVTADVAAALVTTGGAGTAYAHVAGIEASITPVANAAIIVTNATAPYISGTGTAQVSIRYRIVTA